MPGESLPQGLWLPPRVATLLVAASDSLDRTRAQADFICTGVNDHLVIQAALAMLPGGEGEVHLSEGHFYVEDSINLGSNQTIRGEGRNTILTTTTDGMIFLSAVGGDGSELVHIVIADMQIDGATLGDTGIYFEFVDYSFIINVLSQRHQSGIGALCSGIYLLNSDSNTIGASIFEDNDWGCGIYLGACNNNIISDNQCFNNPSWDGIYLVGSHYNIIVGNICYSNCDGISVVSGDNNIITGNVSHGNVEAFGLGGIGIILDTANSNTITGNISQGNERCGFYLYDAANNTIVGNTLNENSQALPNTYADIYLDDGSSYNLIEGNLCRAGALANAPNYGIDVAVNTCVGNVVIGNDLYDDGFGTAPFNDAGTGTKLNTYCAPFVDGSDPQDSGYLIDANTEYARSYLRLPDKVVQVVRMKVYARSVVAEGDKMRGEFVIYGAADNEGYQTHNGSVANHPSASSNFAANDVVFWTITTAGVLALLGGDSVEVKVLHEAAGGADCATNAYFRTVEIEYV
jgi:parallel beta-helix repeat protein